MVKNALFSHIHQACFPIVLQSKLLATTSRWVNVFSSSWLFSLKHKGSMGPATASSTSNSSLIPSSVLADTPHQYGWAAAAQTSGSLSDGFAWGKSVNDSAQAEYFLWFFHRMAQLWELRPTSEPELPPLTNGFPITLCFGYLKGLF